MDFEIRVYNSVNEIGQTDWDQLSCGQSFASYRWYLFGEKSMSDCIPVYIILSQQEKAVARATFWVIRNEPMPINWAPARYLAQALLRRWPLFICRSPLANASGLLLPDPPLRHLALATLSKVALQEAKKYNASFLLYDFLDNEQAGWDDWFKPYFSYSFSDPGTKMEIAWSSFERYLESLSPKVRKHYRQHQREAKRLGIQIREPDTVTNIDKVIGMVQSVERRHGSTPNPWTRGMLENLGMVDGVWLSASREGRVVGCELILEDNGTHMVTALGLADSVSHIYHLLGYADIRHAIETGARFLRWGSGSYDTKRRLGFEIERNNCVVFYGLNPLSRLVARITS
jgi:predicted N-acyltransferase